MVELLVSLAVSLAVLAAFTGFYAAQQRSFRRHQVEIAASQSLRNALEQISRDLRSAGLDPTGGGTPGLTLADATEVDFTLDADLDGFTSGAAETKKFRWSGTTVESYQAGSATWLPLADSVTGLAFGYYACGGTTPLTPLPLDAAARATVMRIDVTLTVGGSGGITLSRSETESVRLRNEACS